MSAKKKSEAKSTVKRRKRRLLTLFRICRYGTESFLRNSWLSVAAVAVMTITLLIIFCVFASHLVLTDTIGSLRDKVDMSIYLKTDTPDDAGNKIAGEVKKLSSVKSVDYISPSEARDQVAKDNANNAAILDAIKEATNLYPATIRVTLNNIDETQQLQDFVDKNSDLKKWLNPDREPSFRGERKEAINSIGRSVGFAQKVGILASSIFVIVSSLIIFNTIRMAIFNRKEEIQMMKLIGAEKSFIRGPFLIESIIYGTFAALVASGLGYLGLIKIAPSLIKNQIAIQPTLDLLTKYTNIPLVLLAMVGIGALIGIISSLFATHRYLKI